jgi:hypothetical protein
MKERRGGAKHRRRFGLTARRWLPISKLFPLFVPITIAVLAVFRCRCHRCGGRLCEPIPGSWISERLRQRRPIRRRRERGPGICLGDRSSQRREQAHTRDLRNRHKSYQCRPERSRCHSRTPKRADDRPYGSNGRLSGGRYGFSEGHVHSYSGQSRRCGRIASVHRARLVSEFIRLQRGRLVMSSGACPATRPKSIRSSTSEEHDDG